MRPCNPRVTSAVRAAIVALAVVGLGALLFACSRPSSERREPVDLQTVDIEPAPDAELSTELDEKGRRPSTGLGGVLPTSVPRDLAVYEPSSLVDFGELADGRHFIEVDTPAPLSGVRIQVIDRLRAVDWEVSSESETSLVLSKGGRRLTVTLRQAGRGTRIRYEFVPGA